MELSLAELFKLKTVTASKKAQDMSDAPAIITVVTANQIKERGYQTVAEALECIVGIDILQDHFQPNLGVRGINSGRRSYSRIVKVMIDGQSVANRSSSDNYLGESLIPIYAIERIEIIKGPNSALYGADAYLGVINIITKTGKSGAHGSISVGPNLVQGNPGYSGELMLDGKFDDFDYLLSGSIGKTDRSGLAPVDLPDRTTFANQGELTKNDLTEPRSLFAKVKYGNERIGAAAIDFNYQYINSFGEFQDWAVNTHNNRISLYNMYVRAKYDKAFLENFNANISFAYANGAPTRQEHLDIDTSSTEWVTRPYMVYHGLDAKAEVLYNYDERNCFTIGGDFTADKHSVQRFYRTWSGDSLLALPGAPDAALDSLKEFDNAGAYLQSIINPFGFFTDNFLSRFNLTLGVRMDRHIIYGTNISYRAAGIYKISDQFTAKLLYGTSFKAPSPTQLYTNFIKSNDIIGNPKLKPETARIVDLQISGQFARYFYVSIDGFLNNTENKVELVIPDYSSTVGNIRAENLAAIKSVGTESELMFNNGNFQSYVNYSFQKSTITKETISMDVELYPSHMIKSGINLKVPAAFLNLNAEGQYISQRIASEFNTRIVDASEYISNRELYAQNRYTLDSYLIFNAGISTCNIELFKQYETEIMLKINNVLNQKYAFPGFKGSYDIPGLNRWYSLQIRQSF